MCTADGGAPIIPIGLDDLPTDNVSAGGVGVGVGLGLGRMAKG